MPANPLSPAAFNLDPHLPDPIYRQLMAQIRRLIAAGQLRPGDELPSVRALATTHAVNPMTISRAFSQLESEGVLQRNRGAAMTVADTPVDSPDGLALLQPALRRLVSEARQLGFSREALLLALQDVYDNDKDPAS